MSEPRRGLGRGLSALLDEAAAAGEGPGHGAREVPIEQIHHNIAQPRVDFDDEGLARLAASIRDKGVLQPILVRPSPERAGDYQIVAGERRWRAAQAAGLATVPIVLRDLDDRETLEIGIVENVQRTDLNPVEEASGFQALVERFGRTQEEVAATVGRSRSHVANALRLLDLPPPLVEMLRRGRLTAGHARAIATAPNPVSLAHQVIERGLSVRAAEALGRRAQAEAGRGARTSPGKDADTRALEADLTRVLGLSVEVSHKGGRGALTVRYRTLEQLDDICRRLRR
jgi:ParB family chromosome partitioning protein